MGIITKDKTWADNENVTFTDINANFDSLYNEFNGNIDNANIKANAGIESAKIVTILDSKQLTAPVITGEAGATPTVAGQVKYDSTANQLKYGNGSTTITVGQQYRSFTWCMPGTSIDGVAEQVYIAPATMTVTKIYGITTSGTCTATLKKGSTVIDTIACSSNLATETTITSALITAGDLISLTLSVSSSPVNLKITMECLQS